MTDVVITGLGALCHIGGSVPDLLQALDSPSRPRTQPAPGSGPRMPIDKFGLIPEELAPTSPTRSSGVAVGQATRTALAAAVEALADAGDSDLESDRIGVTMGTANGDSYLVEEQRSARQQAEPGRWVPTFATASIVAESLGVQGPAVTVSNACAGSGYAIALGVDMIRAGDADMVVAGGYETFSRIALAVFNQVGAVTAEQCRPFDANRTGTVLGEGAGAVVIERADRARARGARIYATVAGQGWSCDAYHATGLDPAGGQLVRAMRDALADAGVKSDDVSFVVPHGTGTKANDEVEVHAMKEVFGAGLSDVPLYSLKAMLGHTAGASGALAVIAAASYLRRGSIPPNLPVDTPDPRFGLHLPVEPTPLRGRIAMVNSYAFGGNNMSLVLTGDES